MTSLPPVPPPPEDLPPPTPEAAEARARKLDKIGRRWSRRRVGTIGLLGFLLLILAAGLTIRLGVLTDPGRRIVMGLVERQEIGRLGRLHVEGLSGDLFGEFSLTRLAVVDGRGAWLEGRDLTLKWDPLALVFRRFHARAAHISTLRVLRAPALAPDKGGPPGKLPVAVYVDDLKLRLETDPAFSVRPGVWDISGQGDLHRNGAANLKLDAQSRLHHGDGLAMLVRVGAKGRMTVRADAVEGGGGALAGSLGLPASERLYLHVRADGTDKAGTLSAVAESGARRPLSAVGHWGQEGASLDGHVLLDASKLTADYAAKMGPDVHVTVRARNVGGDLYQVEASADARDAALAVKGPLDWRRRRTAGMAATASVTDFHRWIDVLNAGPTRIEGTLSGDPNRWRLQGRGEMQRFDQWGYRLARATGPTTFIFTPGEQRLQTDLATAGGAGEGLIPVLFGAAPHIRLDGSRLAGGKLLVRDLGVEGAGLVVKAVGDRSILGLLSLRGDLTMSRLERAHAGAKGLVRASWTASQSGDNPWRLTADAHGEGFATGYAEADRLLGPTPRFNGEGTFGEGLTLTRSELIGASGQAQIRGTIDQHAVLALDTDWRARGPFAVGPVEIAGEAMGTGKIAGRFEAPSVDLVADLASVDFGRLVVKPAHLVLQVATDNGLTGRVALTGSSQWGPAHGEGRFRVVGDGLDLSEVVADAGGVKASGALALRDGAPSSADLTLAVGPGAALDAGRLAGTVKIAERPGGATANIVLDGSSLRLPGMTAGLKTLHLRADGPFARLPFQLSADADQPFTWRFAGDGLLTQTGAGHALAREVSLTGAGRVRQAEVRTREPLVLRFAPTETVVKARLAVGPNGRADIDLRQAAGALQAKGEVAGVELASFTTAYTGRLTGSLALNGRGDQLGGTADAAIEDGRDRDAPANVGLSAKLHADLAAARLRIAATATNPQGLTSKLDLDVPAEASAAPFRVALVRNRPISGDFNAQGELRPLWDLLAGGARTLSGRGSVQAGLSGTLNNLQLTGQAAIEGGRFQDAGTGLDLKNLAVQASFDRGAVALRRFTGDDGRGGQLNGSGSLSLEPEGASSLVLDLKSFRLIDNELARASASGQVTVSRDAAGKARLVGALTIDRADITANPPVASGVVPLDVIEINRPGRPEGAEPLRTNAGGPQIALDVTIRAARGVFIKGNGLDAELSVNAHVGGLSGAPDLTGVARIVRGDYQFAGKRFEFDDRGSIRLGSHAETIRLDLTATRDDPTLKAIVRIVGTAAKPEITLSSNPVLPQDEVLSQVLFGRSAAQLSPLEAAQLASAVTGLATGGGLDVLGNLRTFAGLDRLAFAGGGGTAATVSGGKYLTNDVYLELTGGGRQGSTAQVEWRVRRNFSLVSTVGASGDARLSVRFRHNY